MADGFDASARDAVQAAGLTLRDGDLDVLRVISSVFDTSMRALEEVDLADLPLEPDLDPSRAPR